MEKSTGHGVLQDLQVKPRQGWTGEVGDGGCAWEAQECGQRACRQGIACVPDVLSHPGEEVGEAAVGLGNGLWCSGPELSVVLRGGGTKVRVGCTEGEQKGTRKWMQPHTTLWVSAETWWSQCVGVISRSYSILDYPPF